LVEDGQCISHTAIRFLRNHVEGSRFVSDAFLLSYFLQMSHDVLHRSPTLSLDGLLLQCICKDTKKKGNYKEKGRKKLFPVLIPPPGGDIASGVKVTHNRLVVLLADIFSPSFEP
jgi:hypothetical protein